MAKDFIKRSENYSEWYNELVVRADLAENSMLKPENDLISQIVYNADGRDVETTIIAGKVLMENRKLCNNIDKNQLYKKCDEIINRIESSKYQTYCK